MDRRRIGGLRLAVCLPWPVLPGPRPLNDGFIFLGHRIIRKRKPQGRMRPVTTIPWQRYRGFTDKLVKELSGNYSVNRWTWWRTSTESSRMGELLPIHRLHGDPLKPHRPHRVLEARILARTRAVRPGGVALALSPPAQSTAPKEVADFKVHAIFVRA